MYHISQPTGNVKTVAIADKNNKNINDFAKNLTGLICNDSPHFSHFFLFSKKL